MNKLNIIEELEAIIRQLGIFIRYEKGDFEGGYCILRDKRILVVNKRLNDSRKAVILARALYEIGIDSVFVKPVVREFIEDEVAKARKSSV